MTKAIKKRISLILCAMLLLSGAMASCAKDGQGQQGDKPAETSTDAIKVSEDAVKKMALERVPGANENHITSLICELEDGRWVYEGEIKYNGIEYDFEIDAQNGNILAWEIDD